MLNKTTNRYAFELTDHLGNVRAVVAKNASTSAVDVLSYTDYYPHGGVLPGRNFVSSPSYKLGYQGQEKDAETNFSNFELRQMDARLGRWFNPDPMGQYFSPYLAMGNNPVSMVDPTGGLAEEELGADVNYGDWMDAGFNSAGDYQQFIQSYDPMTTMGDRYQNRMDALSNAAAAGHWQSGSYGDDTDGRGVIINNPLWVGDPNFRASDYLGPDQYNINLDYLNGFRDKKKMPNYYNAPIGTQQGKEWEDWIRIKDEDAIKDGVEAFNNGTYRTMDYRILYSNTMLYPGASDPGAYFVQTRNVIYQQGASFLNDWSGDDLIGSMTVNSSVIATLTNNKLNQTSSDPTLVQKPVIINVNVGKLAGSITKDQVRNTISNLLNSSGVNMSRVQINVSFSESKTLYNINLESPAWNINW